jgi:O-antigen/teichoic acid export membrane protein
MEKSKVILIGGIISVVSYSAGMLILGPIYGIVGLSASLVISTSLKTVFFAIILKLESIFK